MVGDDIRDAGSVEWDVALANDTTMQSGEEWDDPGGTIPDNFIPTPPQK